MELAPGYDYRPDLDAAKALLLDMANERSLGALPRLVVRRVAGRPPIGLVQIWHLPDSTQSTLRRREHALAPN